MAGSIGTKTVILPVLEIKNISNQSIPFNIKKVSQSQIYNAAGGTISLFPSTNLVVEQSRIDIRQLQKLSNKKLLNYRVYNQQVMLNLPAKAN